MEFKLHYFGHEVIENAPFSINRPEGSFRYIFFHFISPVNIETEEGIFEAKPGSCILYAPGVKQNFYVDHQRLKHDYLDFTIEDPSFFEDVRFPLNTVINPRMSKKISDYIERIHLEENSNRVGNQYLISNLISNLFISISRKIHNHTIGPNRTYEERQRGAFEQLRLQMFHNPENFTVRFMAEKLDFSLPYFNALYKKFFHVTPIKDLTNARADYTLHLLKNNESINVITKKLGFSSVEYFYRWFKNYFHQTPNDYKNNLK